MAFRPKPRNAHTGADARPSRENKKYLGMRRCKPQGSVESKTMHVHTVASEIPDRLVSIMADADTFKEAIQDQKKRK